MINYLPVITADLKMLYMMTVLGAHDFLPALNLVSYRGFCITG